MRLSWKHILIYIMPLLIMGFIFAQSALSAELSSEESGFFVDWICGMLKADPEIVTVVVRKTAHFSEYFVLGMSLGAAVFTGTSAKRHSRREDAESRCGDAGQHTDKKSGRKEEINRIIWSGGSGMLLVQAGLIGVLYAVSDEIHQCFVPGRSGELRDVLIDSAGVICGVVILRLLGGRKAARE